MEAEPHTIHADTENWFEDPDVEIPSSPFLDAVAVDRISPRKSRSPSKHRSPKKHHSSRKYSQGSERAVPLTEHALKKNEGLTNRVESIRHKRQTSLQYSDNGYDSMSAAEGHKSYLGTDDTGFSGFSALPNTDMTMFAQLGRSSNQIPMDTPSKSPRRRDAARTPQYSRPTTPGTRLDTDEDPSPTPRRQPTTDSNDTTNLILDFTEQFSNLAQPISIDSPKRKSRPSLSKSNTQPSLAKYTSALRNGRSPDKHMPPHTPSSRHLANLLDFDITPAPTPRSVPSITPREVESLKSSFLSQISSLQATLDGRETEINSLKKGIHDAERRAGDALEELHELKNVVEGLEADKVEWERRDRETQTVFRGLKEEVIHGDRERIDLASKLAETEKRLSESESILASLRAATATSSQPSEVNCTPGSADQERKTAAAMEKLARELHGAYQAKHENKVVALKKSYEIRWEKRVQDLVVKVEELKRENAELRVINEAGFSAVIPNSEFENAASNGPSLIPSTPEEDTLRKQKADEEKAELERQRVEAERQKAEQVAKLQSVETSLAKLSKDHEILREDLDRERREKGDLVAAVEEMLLMQASTAAPAPVHLPPSTSGSATTTSYPSGLPPHPPSLTTSASTSSLPQVSQEKENFKSSFRASGLKGPGFGSSYGTAGLKRSVSGSTGMVVKSGIMGSIERMGRGRGE